MNFNDHFLSLAAPNLQPNKIEVQVDDIAVFNCSVQDDQCNENNCFSTGRKAFFETEQFRFDHMEYIKANFQEIVGNYNISCSCGSSNTPLLMKTFSLLLRAFPEIADFVPYVQCIEEHDSGQVQVYSQTALLQLLLPDPTPTPCANTTVTSTSTIRTTATVTHTQTISITPTLLPYSLNSSHQASSSSIVTVLSTLLLISFIL